MSDKQVLILGNGVSRQKESVIMFIDIWPYEIWGCNHIYKDIDTLPRLNRIGTVHTDVAIHAIGTKGIKGYDYKVYTTKALTDSVTFIKPYGWCTGALMVLQAILEKYEKIVLAGFDFGGKDVYQLHHLYGGNFINQFIEIWEKYDTSMVKFIGREYPDFLQKVLDNKVEAS